MRAVRRRAPAGTQQPCPHPARQGKDPALTDEHLHEFPGGALAAAATGLFPVTHVSVLFVVSKIAAAYVGLAVIAACYGWRIVPCRAVILWSLAWPYLLALAIDAHAKRQVR